MVRRTARPSRENICARSQVKCAYSLFHSEVPWESRVLNALSACDGSDYLPVLRQWHAAAAVSAGGNGLGDLPGLTGAPFDPKSFSWGRFEEAFSLVIKQQLLGNIKCPLLSAFGVWVDSFTTAFGNRGWHKCLIRKVAVSKLDAPLWDCDQTETERFIGAVEPADASEVLKMTKPMLKSLEKQPSWVKVSGGC